MTLVSCALHELGHLVLMTAFGSSPQEIVVYGGGIRITPDNKQLSKYHELAVLFGGAAVNFALCLLTYLTNGGGFFCQVNFLLGALNLLPFRYFDGGRILALLANGKVCEFFRAVFILLTAVATAIDDNAAYEKSDKSIWRLLNIRCTSHLSSD